MQVLAQRTRVGVRKLLLLVCAVVWGGSVACSKVSDQTAMSGTHAGTVQPGILRVALPQDVKSLNSLLGSSTAEGFVERLMFEPLISADEHGVPVPILVRVIPTIDNGGISTDGLTIVYHLRRDIRWSDGVALTSKDVRWSWQAIMNPTNNVVARHGYDVVRSIDTPDDATIIVHLKERFAPFVNTFFAESDQPFNIMPAHVLSKYPDVNQISFNTAPTVSDGPFRFVEWVHGDHITLAANDKFFLGRPKLRQIRINVVPDEHTTVQLLRTHEIDYMFQASINTYKELKTVPGVKIVWNNMNGYQGIEINLSRPVLRDRRVRLAIASAIDKAELVRTLTDGMVKVATEDLPDWMWAFNPNARPLSFDPERARKLLREAGYTAGPDGMFARNGERLRLVLVTDVADATHRKICELVQAMLKTVGIDASIKFYPADLLYAPAGMGGILHRGMFDLMMLPWYAGIDPDNSSQFMCRNMPPNGYNDTHYCTPEMDRLQANALSAYDVATRRRSYFGIESLLARDNPVIILWWQRQQEPISVEFKGFAPNPTVESWNAWQWSI
jgi:peptide/nickel transport system substrate-binding protein